MRHLVYLESEYSIVPKDAYQINILKDLYDKDFLQDGKRYKAYIEGEGWEFKLGAKAHSDRTKVVYSIVTNWKAGEKLPWFSITHDLPMIDINASEISRNQGIKIGLETSVQSHEQKMASLFKTNKESEEHIKLGTGKNFEERIKSNNNIIASRMKDIQKEKTEIIDKNRKQLYLSILIKSKLGVAQLLRKFADISVKGLGIDKSYAENNNLQEKLDEYKVYYDANIQKILEMCDEDLKNNIRLWDKSFFVFCFFMMVI